MGRGEKKIMIKKNEVKTKTGAQVIITIREAGYGTGAGTDKAAVARVSPP